MSLYMSYCPECSEKLGKVRTMSEISGLHYGYCQGCFRQQSVRQYELGPTWEAAERQRRRSRGPRAGERERRHE